MPKARIHDGELTIPLSDELREKLGVHDGDEVEAHVFSGGLTITRASSAARAQAGQRLLDIIDRVRLRPGQQPLTEDEIAEEVKVFRRERAAND